MRDWRLYPVGASLRPTKLPSPRPDSCRQTTRQSPGLCIPPLLAGRLCWSPNHSLCPSARPPLRSRMRPGTKQGDTPPQRNTGGIWRARCAHCSSLEAPKASECSSPWASESERTRALWRCAGPLRGPAGKGHLAHGQSSHEREATRRTPKPRCKPSALWLAASPASFSKTLTRPRQAERLSPAQHTQTGRASPQREG